MENLRIASNSTLSNLKLKLIKIIHFNYDIVDICCDKENISECLDTDYIDPNKKYLLPMYLVLRKKEANCEFKFVKYHTYSDCAVGLMTASRFLGDVTDLKKQAKEMKLTKYERKNNRSCR